MPVPPLNPHVRIVDESGRPTPEFIRWWQSQRDENTGIPDLSDPGTVSGALDSIGDERGQILYRGATEWLPLAPGTVNYVLTSAGAGADPAWAAAVRSFLDLSDTPAAYTGAADKLVKVNAGTTGLEFGDLDFLALTDTPADYTGQAGKAVKVNAGATGLEFGDLASTFLQLTDAPSAYTGQGGKVVGVKATEDGLEFVTGGGGGGGGASWTLIDSKDFSVSSDTSFEVTDLDDYDEWLIIGDGLDGTGNFDLKMRLSIDNGSSFDSTSSHYLATFRAGTGTSGTTNAFEIGSNSAVNPQDLLLKILKPGDVNTRTYMDSVQVKGVVQFSGLYYTKANTNALTIYDSGGATINSGTILVFARSGGGGGGASAFIDLTDVPSDYTGAAGKAVVVNGDADGLEFESLSPVAFSGSYNDLGDTPPTSITLSTETSAFSVTDTHLSGLQHIACDFSADDDVTIPSGLTGTEPVRFLSVGPGRPSFVPGTGVTLLTLNDHGIMLGPGAQATLIPLGADEYLLWGDIGSDDLLLLSGDESGYMLLSGDANSGSSRLELSGV